MRSRASASRRAYFNPPTPRGVGRAYSTGISPFGNFNPPTPRGVGRFDDGPTVFPISISIHPPREGVGLQSLRCTHCIAQFQSTHPARGWDGAACAGAGALRISIHPPREGVGPRTSFISSFLFHFNPPTPRGGGTDASCKHLCAAIISIHPPREGVGRIIRALEGMKVDFNPPTPRGGGTAVLHRPFRSR